MQRENSLTGDNIEILRQGLDLLDRLSDDLYTGVRPPSFNYGAGAHFRHCLDSYNCFLAGIEQGRIDYDLRERKESIERNRSAARARIESVIVRLQALEVADGEKPIAVKTENADPEEEASWSSSSFMRELQFLMSHTVHHYAIIAVLLRIQGFEPGEAFGVAPSTLKHWRQISQCAR